MAASTDSDIRTTVNVIAETSSGRDDNVVVVGAHLDSVIAGPGINDNGSGSSAILEVAIQMAKVKPRNTVRFIWFGAEELDLVGSEHYVSQLSEEEIADIAVMLNFDMVGSPNSVRSVYDGDNSAFPIGPGAAAGPPAQAAVYGGTAGVAHDPCYHRRATTGQRQHHGRRPDVRRHRLRRPRPRPEHRRGQR